ncbi:ABC transporter transmembrane domain-containing protein, partial [Candidatus Pelagibacter sp.]|nr:ABC transporter transmembrane domain-containing protein [Candidatus Pelagibacter sp.]
KILMKNSEIYKRLYKNYSKKYINKILISVFFGVLVAGSTSAIAWLLDPAIKKIFVEKDQSLIFVIPLLIIVAFAIKGFALYLAKAIMIRVAEEIKKILQSEMVKSLINADTQLIDKKHSGKFISNLTYDVTHITNMLSTAILSLFKDSLTLLGLLFVMFYQNWKLSLIAIIMIPIAGMASKTLGKRVGKVVTEAQEKSGFLNTHLIELFKNHKLIKIFQRENYESKRTDSHLNQLKEKNIKIHTVYVRLSPIMETLTGIMIAILIFYSGKLALNNEIEIGNFFSFLAAMMLAYQPVRALAGMNMILKQGLSAANRILPIIDNENKITDREGSRDIDITNSDIKFNNINFKYNSNEENVLKNINLNISGGKMTSLVGHSGSGKSTILNLIPRFYDVQSGNILIDNQSIYEVKIKSLRDKISLVSQDTTLFDDTIRNNIKYAKDDVSDKEIISAAKFSYAHEFIDKLPNGYETIIGENGVRLSGGEKQRLSIARAMIKKSPIILLDEATSSLDAETESKIQDALKILTKDRTTIVIAHRLSTILNSDQIYIIDAGNVVANGKHDELLNTSELYKNFYEKQIRKG